MCPNGSPFVSLTHYRKIKQRHSSLGVCHPMLRAGVGVQEGHRVAKSTKAGVVYACLIRPHHSTPSGVPLSGPRSLRLSSTSMLVLGL